jgi:hypothetical protein
MAASYSGDSSGGCNGAFWAEDSAAAVSRSGGRFACFLSSRDSRGGGIAGGAGEGFGENRACGRRAGVNRSSICRSQRIGQGNGSPVSQAGR